MNFLYNHRALHIIQLYTPWILINSDALKIHTNNMSIRRSWDDVVNTQMNKKNIFMYDDKLSTTEEYMNYNRRYLESTLNICLLDFRINFRDRKVHGANMGPTWVLSVPDGPHVGPMNLATRVTVHPGQYVPSLSSSCFVRCIADRHDHVMTWKRYWPFMGPSLIGWVQT